VVGLGANLGCLAGAIPNIDQLNQLELHRELLELKFGRKIPKLSAGSSAVLPLLCKGLLPKAVNHFRIGESVFLGTDLIEGGVLRNLRNDVVVVEGEIAEIKEKSLVSPCATMDMAPFASVGDNNVQPPGTRGYRALVALGQLDTDVAGLTPIDPAHRIAGASSDITVVNLGADPTGLQVGDTIRFRVNYSGLLRLMNNKYIAKVLVPGADRVEQVHPNRQERTARAVLSTHCGQA
jgi:predicted amino acid racemase